MPDNWPAWAATYPGQQWADQSPLNQELVARDKVTGLPAGRRVHVIAATLGPNRRVVWIKVRLPSGAAGWINSSRTLPQRTPKHGGHAVHH